MIIAGRKMFTTAGRRRTTGQTPSALLNGIRLRDDLGFKPQFRRLADAIAAGA
jgi:hypothetical protein